MESIEIKDLFSLFSWSLKKKIKKKIFIFFIFLEPQKENKENKSLVSIIFILLDTWKNK
jgi:hypothetical protein